MMGTRDRIWRLAVIVVLAAATAGCPAGPQTSGSGDAASPPAPSAPVATADAAPSSSASPSNDNRPTDPLEIFKRNIGLAAAACGGCKGQKDINLPPAERAAAMRELISDSNKSFRLSEVNAQTALRGPVGTVPKVAGRAVEGADVTFVGPDGNDAFLREVKCVTGGNFGAQVSKAASQVRYDGEVFVQMPPGADVNRLLNSFWGARTDADLWKYRYVWVAVHDPTGARIGGGMLGLRGMTL